MNPNRMILRRDNMKYKKEFSFSIIDIDSAILNNNKFKGEEKPLHLNYAKTYYHTFHLWYKHHQYKHAIHLKCTLCTFH